MLIAITDRADPGVILTQRPSWLRSHAGQVAFPGGKIDADDADAIAAALREAQEEIALPASMSAFWAKPILTIPAAAISIAPVIGIIPPDLPLDGQS